MKKKNTFADAATKIINKYKLRLGKDLDKHDPLAREGLERELDELKSKQETFKQQQQQLEQQQAIANQFVPEQSFQMNIKGDMPQYAWGSPEGDDEDTFMTEIERMEQKKMYPMQSNTNYRLPSSHISSNNIIPKMQLRNTQNNISSSNIQLQKVPNQSVDILSQRDIGPNYTYDKDLNQIVGGNNSTPEVLPSSNRNISIFSQEKELDPYNPTLGGASPIPLIAGLAGSALMYRGAKASDINYDRVSPEEIDLSAEREEARRQADLTRNLTSRNARGVGLNAGATATLGVASQADIQGKLGANINKSYLNEQLANTQARQRANQINADISMKEQESRLREKDTVTSFKQQAIQDALGSMGKYFGDVQKGRQFNNYLESKDQIYNRYEDPEQSTFGRIINPQYIIRSDKAKVKNYNE